MIRRFILRRREDISYEELKPGEYLQYYKRDGWGDVTFAVWRCPVCEETSSCSRRLHHVDHEGDVHPSSVCPHKTADGNACTFHEFVHFDAWHPEPQGEA